MSSFSNSCISDACNVAPRAASSEGLIAVGLVEGAKTFVDCGNVDWTFCETRGVCDVPPERMT